MEVLFTYFFILNLFDENQRHFQKSHETCLELEHNGRRGSTDRHTRLSWEPGSRDSGPHHTEGDGLHVELADRPVVEEGSSPGASAVSYM